MSIAYELTPCIACGANDATVLADADALRVELEQLWSHHMERLVPATPAAQLADRVAFSQPLAARVVRCAACGLVYRNPIERAHEVLDLYGGDTAEPAVLARLHDTQLAALRAQARRLTRIVGRAGTVLEVGSYVGGFLTAARELGWTAIGVDVNPAVNAWVRSRGLHVVDGEIGDATGLQPDVIAFWNCLDQLPDPAAALREARERLADGGWVVARVPNGNAWVQLRSARWPLRRAARLLMATNNLLAFPYRYGFTPGSIARLFARTGLTVERIVPDTLVPLADRWTTARGRREELVVKRVTQLLARLRVLSPPWFEVYARRG